MRISDVFNNVFDGSWVSENSGASVDYGPLRVWVRNQPRRPNSQNPPETILGLQLTRPRFHGFPIKFVLKNDHFGAQADHAQIPWISN